MEVLFCLLEQFLKLLHHFHPKSSSLSPVLACTMAVPESTETVRVHQQLSQTSREPFTPGIVGWGGVGIRVGRSGGFGKEGDSFGKRRVCISVQG